MLNNLLADFRYALRTLRKAPAFAVVAVATLALGIGANTAIFSVVHAVLLRPLPFPDADRLVVVWERNIPRSRERNVVASVNYVAWREAAADIGEFAALGQVARTLGDDGTAERIGGASLTPNVLRMLGGAPALGRVFTDADGVPGHEPVVLLSQDLWQRRFGGDTAVIGRAARLDDQAYTIVGVMPAGFSLPAVGPFGDEAFFLPLAVDPAGDFTGRSLFVLGRLTADATVAGAQDLLRGVAARLAQREEYNEGWSVNVVPLFDEVVGDARSMVLVLLGAVGLILLIACVNVAAMVLARGSARVRELAVRQALGASRVRLLGHLLAEGVALAALAGFAGLGLGVWGRDALVALAPEGVPRLDEVSLSVGVLAFVGGVTLLVGIVLGLVPLLRTGSPDVGRALRGGSRGVTEHGGRRVRDGLVLAEVALALVLCVSAGLAIKSFTRLRHIDPGYRPEGVLTARVAPSGNRYEKDADLVAFYDALLTSLRAQPGMVEAAATARLPLDGLWVGTSFLVRDRPEPPRAERPVADIRVVTPRYFATLGIPIRSGRDFDASDREGVPYVVVINETMARTFWPDGSAIGRPVAVSLGDPYLEATVVGVVGDVKHQGYDTTPRAMIYFAHGQLAVGTMSVALRTDADPSTLAPVLRAGVAAQDPMVPVYTVAPMTDLVDRSMAADRFGSSLLGGFAALALVLAAVGTYGVVAYGVTRRGREIGIRVALGAADGRVMGMVVRDGMRPVWIGVGAGIVAGLLLTRFLGTLLFDVSPTDPMTFGAGAGVLLLAALTACVIPARRAARIDPLEAIRHE